MSVLVALTRNDIADYVEALVYLILIFALILLSWIPRLPYNRLRAVVDFIHQVTDPYLNLFRVLPPVGGRGSRSISARSSPWWSC